MAVCLFFKPVWMHYAHQMRFVLLAPIIPPTVKQPNTPLNLQSVVQNSCFPRQDFLVDLGQQHTSWWWQLLFVNSTSNKSIPTQNLLIQVVNFNAS